MLLRRDRDAAAAAIAGFAVVVAIYAIAFVAFLSFVEAPRGQQREGPVLEARADSGLLEVVTGEGRTSTGMAWYKDADKITRFGLAQEARPGHLDPDKLRNLTKGNMTRDGANALLDYEEARDALGLGAGYEFHLRTHPVLSTLDEAGLRPVRGLDVAYVGNFSQKNDAYSNYPVLNTSGYEDKGDHVYVNVTITNNGSADTVFQVEFSVPLDDGYLVDTATTPLLAKDPDGSGPQEGGKHTASLKLYKTSAWEWASSTNKKVSVKISDPSKKVGDFSIDLSSVDMTSPAYGTYAAVSASPGKLWYKTNQKPAIHFDLWEGDGDTKKNVDVKIWVNNSAGSVASWQGQTSGNNKWTLPDTLAAGWYNVTIHLLSDPTFNGSDAFQVTDADVGDFTSGGSNDIEQGSDSEYERGLLERLVDGWVNRTYDDRGGDVYPDLKKVMNNDLGSNLTNYDVLVVGSNVDHTAMTSDAAKSAVKDFVLGGGLLVVLGSQDQQVTWLQPLFHATLTTSGESIGVPDPTHPILHVPEELAWQTYVDNGKTWEFNTDEDASHFTHVIVREGGGNKQKDVLAVSKPGHFGNGTIVLTAWTIFALTSPQSGDEALATMYNFLLHALGYLFIDFGPSIPTYAEVASSTRLAAAPHPAVKDEQVLVRVVLYVFR